MKDILKSVFNFETILTCYISAVGYGVGFNLPKKLNLHPIICIVCCLVLGSIFDLFAKKILSTKYFRGSFQNKVTTATCVYFGYILAWLIVNHVLEYDIDTDFLVSITLIIIIQIVLLIIKFFKEYFKEKRNNKQGE